MTHKVCFFKKHFVGHILFSSIIVNRYCTTSSFIGRQQSEVNSTLPRVGLQIHWCVKNLPESWKPEFLRPCVTQLQAHLGRKVYCKYNGQNLSKFTPSTPFHLTHGIIWAAHSQRVRCATFSHPLVTRKIFSNALSTVVRADGTAIGLRCIETRRGGGHRRGGSSSLRGLGRAQLGRGGHG